MDDICSKKITIPRTGIIARISQQREIVGHIEYKGEEIAMVRTRYGKVEGLPERPEPDTLYIVSSQVAQALSRDPAWRGKLVVPDTGPGSAVRDQKGRIIGVKYLIKW